MAKYLDSSGITHLVSKLKGIFAAKATTLAGYGITNGVTTPTINGSGNAVTTASVSGHTLTLTKGSTFALASAVPKLRVETASSTASVSNLASTETLFFDASALSYTAGKQFWLNLLQADRTNGYGHYVGFVLTGAATCYIKFGGLAAWGGGGDKLLSANSAYHFDLFCYGKSSTNFAKGYIVWTKYAAAT